MHEHADPGIIKNPKNALLSAMQGVVEEWWERMSGAGGIWSGAAFCFGLDAGERGTDRCLPGGGDAAGHHWPAAAKSVPSSPEYSSLVVPSCPVRVNSSVMCGTGPRTSRKAIRFGRSNVTVSSVAAVSLPWCTGV